jgi:hypothetical protein
VHASEERNISSGLYGSRSKFPNAVQDRRLYREKPLEAGGSDDCTGGLVYDIFDHLYSHQYFTHVEQRTLTYIRTTASSPLDANMAG